MRRESGGKTKKEINVIVELKAERFNEDSEQLLICFREIGFGFLPKASWRWSQMS